MKNVTLATLVLISIALLSSLVAWAMLFSKIGFPEGDEIRLLLNLGSSLLPLIGLTLFFGALYQKQQ